jgi:hypothetical protein
MNMFADNIKGRILRTMVYVLIVLVAVLASISGTICR